MISIKHLAGDEWQVTVKSGVTTYHRVRVLPPVHERLSGGGPVEELLRESFRFLLERESNTAILPSFDLSVIGTYFPDYEAEMRRRFGGRD